MSEVRREGYKFCQDICVPCYDTDASFYLKPAAFMDMAQEIAYWAAQELGFGYDDLHVHHVAWVLSRMHFHFGNPPKWRDDVTLYTWHKGADGLFYLRDFFLQDADGNRLVTCTSSWVVIDERTRRLVRPEELQDKLSTGDVDDAIDGFNTLLTQGYMAHPDDFNSAEMQRQVRATTYLMGVVRRCLADHVQERLDE